MSRESDKAEHGALAGEAKVKLEPNQKKNDGGKEITSKNAIKDKQTNENAPRL